MSCTITIQRLFLLPALLLFGYSCKKEKTQATIDGTLFDLKKNTPISGITVSIIEFRPTTFAYEIKTTQSCVTGNDGKYHFEFRINQSKEYRINLISKKYNSYSMGYVFHNGEHYEYDYWLPEK
jgi:hypothetical protein